MSFLTQKEIKGHELLFVVGYYFKELKIEKITVIFIEF